MLAGHAGEKKTHAKLKETYDNIPIMAVRAFIAECERCLEKKKRKETVSGTVVKPIIVSDLNQRGQVDLVDMQSMKDGAFAYIMHCQEHLSKFHILRPLVNKTADAVARELLMIFLDFGAPRVLQSDNGCEFTANVIKELAEIWPELVLVNGCPRHPQTQGSVERANGAMKDKLTAWMRDNRCTGWWTLGIRFVQWQMNTGKEPYKVMFGKKPCLGLAFGLPLDFLQKIDNGIYEEVLTDMIEGQERQSVQTDMGGPSEQTDMVEPSGQTDVAWPSGQTDMADQSGQTDVAWPSGQTDMAGQNRQTDMAGQSGQTDVAGQSGQTDMAGQSGQTDMAGQSGQTDMAGPSGQTDVASPSGQTDMAGQNRQTDMAGQSGQTDVAGQSGQTDMAGQSGQTDMAGQSGQTDRHGGAEWTNRRSGAEWTDKHGGSEWTDRHGGAEWTDRYGRTNKSDRQTNGSRSSECADRQ